LCSVTKDSHQPLTLSSKRKQDPNNRDEDLKR
jgi:hypothetical protein